jgi:tetratricopeptide (TPR) repeat protein
MKPFCFVLMPFGKKLDDSGRVIDFDRVYQEIIKPATELAGLAPIRADEEVAGGIIHKPMFERLMLCDYAIADLTTANANVFYELGVRHGIRPHSTVVMFGRGMRLPFDVSPLRGIPYDLDSVGAPEHPAAARAILIERLNACRDPKEDSPLFQLVAEWPRPDIARLKTDRFRELVGYSQEYKTKLAIARAAGVDAVARIEQEINVLDADPAIVVDLYLSYRAVEAWNRMVDLVGHMSPILARSVMIREQLGFALNRLGRWKEAELVLQQVIEENGPSSETNGLLGRVYKDRWERADGEGRSAEARGYLRKAIQTYLAGYESDLRDGYPGINAVALMELEDPVDPRQAELLPVILFAVRRRLVSKVSDYWDHATLLELSVLQRDQVGAAIAIADTLTSIRERWEPKTTARNLRLIREARAKRGDDSFWISTLEQELLNAPAAQ